MKILHVNGNCSGGGIEQHLIQLFEELDKSGHKNIFLYSQKSCEKQPIDNVDAYCIDKVTLVRCDNFHVKLKKVKKILRASNPDIIYIHQVLNSDLINFLTSCKPTVRYVHGFKMICPEGAKSHRSKKVICPNPLSYLCQLNAYVYRCMPRNPILGLSLIAHSKKNIRIHQKRSHMIVASKFMKSVLLDNGFDERKITIIPYFTCLPKVDKDTLLYDSPIILALGRLVKAKGIRHLVHAFTAVDERAKLVIVGDGPELSVLRRLTKSLGLTSRVSFRGWLQHDKLDEIFRQCSLLVVPSVWPEPFGIVGIEAMAYQRPVVAFDVGGISEWCRDGETGFLVKPRDEIALSKKINLLLDNPDLAKQMGKKGREIVKEHFAPEKHLDHLIPLFQNTIDSYL